MLMTCSSTYSVMLVVSHTVQPHTLRMCAKGTQRVHCSWVRKLKMRPEVQLMADLPQERLSTDPSFTHTRTDLLGSFPVKNGRKEEKRYGAIFTCMSHRAVHIEMVYCLDTDSFVQALRWFLSRRRQVLSIFCDNGTNIIGAERELYRIVYEKTEDIRKVLLEKTIKRHHNPPPASPWSGVWERQLRSIRSVLNVLLDKFGVRLNDESLLTVMCEAEATINSWPLTTISDSPDDLEPLTPNHLLTQKANGSRNWASWLVR